MPSNPQRQRLTPGQEIEMERFMKRIGPQITHRVDEAMRPTVDRVQAVIREICGTPVDELPL